MSTTRAKTKKTPDAALARVPVVHASPALPALVPVSFSTELPKGHANLHEKDVERLFRVLQSSTAESTRRAYKRYLDKYAVYCSARGNHVLTPDPTLVASFLVWLAGRPASLEALLPADCWPPEGPARPDGKPYSYSGIRQAHAAISKAFEMAYAGRSNRKGTAEEAPPDPTKDSLVKLTMQVLANALDDDALVVRKAALSADDVRAMVAELGEDLRGLRDRAMILLGISLATRRSELTGKRGLLVNDVDFSPVGMLVTFRKSKTNQSGGRPDTIGVPRMAEPDVCPVRAIERWMNGAQIVSGPIFRGIHPKSGKLLATGMSPGHFNKRLKQAALNAGIDPRTIGAHSLRAGYATEAAKHGVSMLEAAKGGRWHTLDVMTRYFRPKDAMDAEVASKLGLGTKKTTTTSVGAKKKTETGR